MSRHFIHRLLPAFIALAFLCTANTCGRAEEPPPASDSSKMFTLKKPRSLDELLLFYPSKFPEGNWKPTDLKFEDVYFTAADKTKLHGWYCPCDKPRATILFAHGNGGHVADRAAVLHYFQTELHLATFMFDYRGYGRSAGVPTVEGVLQDARAARSKLAQLSGQKETDLVLMGESLGGALVVPLAAEAPPRGLILVSTFSSLKEVAQTHYPLLAWVVPVDRLNSTALIGQYHGPLLQSHGTADGLVPLAHAEKLFAAASEPKQFVRLPGCDHNNWFNKLNLGEVDAFVSRLERSKM